jgi:hypothetical protein
MRTGLSTLFGFVISSIAIALVASSCSTTPDGDMFDAQAPMPDATMPGACPSGYSQCGADCVPLKRDPLNCGACGKACKAGEVCVQGGCALQCGGNTIKCGAICANPKSDPDNCGMCGTKCAQGLVCNVGKCDVSCQTGLTNCSSACVDLQTDDDNCGACGTVCDPGQKCSAGKCIATCQGGFTSCPNDGGSTCVNLNTDKSNCGACGTQCPNGQFCSPGSDGGMATCGLGCFGGTTKCGNICADLQIDPQNCGACGVPCNGTCFNGMCCSGSQLFCGNACTNIKTDANNCGGCGIKCGGPCNNGVCCGAGETICNGKCSNLQYDPQNCNQCGKICDPDSGQPYCNMGACSNQGGGTVWDVNGNIFPVVFVPCANGQIANCTETAAETSCTNIGKKLVSHASDGTNAVVSLGATTSCFWDISYFTNLNGMVAGQCLVGVSNAKWSSCCGLSDWHGNIVTVPSSLNQQFGYVNAGDSGYKANFSNVSGTTWGCIPNGQAPPPRNGCSTYYVACK